MTPQAILLRNYPNPKMRKNRRCPICGGFLKKKGSNSIVHRSCLPEAKKRGIVDIGGYPLKETFCSATFKCPGKEILYKRTRPLKYVYPVCKFDGNCNQQVWTPPHDLVLREKMIERHALDLDADVAARTKP